MWIAPPSIRLSFALELGCSEKDLQPDFDTWVSIAAVSSTLNGKHTRAQSWKLACRKGLWLQRLYGAAISENSLPLSFVAQWIALLRDSRAKTSALPGGALGLTESAAACSSTSLTLPTIAVRSTSFWRTSAASLLPPPPLWTKPKGLLMSARPPESWENWPTAGGMRNGSLFQRPRWVPATGGLGGSALPGDNWTTPDVCSGARDMSKIDPELQKRANTKRTTGLPTEVMNWATPDCNTSTYSNVKMGPNIREQASQWPTPAARDHKSELGGVRTMDHFNRPNGPSLGAFVAYSPQAQATRNGQESSPQNPGLPQPSTKRLNPYFAERLMGWPTGWTSATEPSASSASETESFRLKQQSLLASLLPELKDFLNDDNK